MPVVAVAAIFQKDPQVLLTQPDAKVAKIEDLKPLTLFVSKEGIASYFQWLKSEYGFNEKQGQALHLQPAAVHRRQEERDAGLRHLRALRGREGGRLQAEMFLLADNGFNTYSTLIETRRDLVEKKPDLVQRFVDASIDRLVQLHLRRQLGGQRA